MKKITILSIFAAMFMLTSCDVMLAVLEEAARQQEQQPQTEQEQQNPGKKDDKVLQREENDTTTTTVSESDKEFYEALSMNSSQITKYEAIKSKYKAQANTAAKDLRTDRPALKIELEKIKVNQEKEIKSILSAAQYAKYTELMNKGIDKKSGN